MTTIAWDGRYLAADKMTVNNGLSRITTKIWRIGDLLVGVSGGLDSGMAMKNWIERGENPDNFPESQKKNDTNTPTCVIRNKEYWVYETTPFPFRIEDDFSAMGSGRDFALMAMRLGLPAKTAVIMTAEFDVGTGGEVDVLDSWRDSACQE